MTTLIIRSSRRKYVLLLIGVVGFVVLGMFIVGHPRPNRPSDVWLGWAMIIFFGSGIPIFIWQLLDNRPRLVIDERGVRDRTLGVGVIPWSEITGAYVQSIHGNDFICLELRTPELWVRKLSRMKRAMVSANRALGFTPLFLNLSGVNARTDEVLELIRKRCAQFS